MDLLAILVGEKPEIIFASLALHPGPICEDLIRQNRADSIVPADYSRNSNLFKKLRHLINRIVEEERLIQFRNK